jgi:predicted  nucleic acid-binding Zn-ribbon protein
VSKRKPVRRNVSHRNQARREMTDGKARSVGWCPECGKRYYADRAQARAAIRQDHPGDSRLRSYCCEQGRWHFGKVPLAVKAGERTIHDPIPEEDPDDAARLRAG